MNRLIIKLWSLLLISIYKWYEKGHAYKKRRELNSLMLSIYIHILNVSKRKKM